MLFRLTWATLTRHRSRTLLAILGVAVSAAMLLDMVMLSSGMRESFRQLLTSSGLEIRVSPKGTLPYDTDATIPNAAAIVSAILATPGVRAVSPVLGGQLHVETARGVVTTAAIGVHSAVQGDYEITQGRQPASANEIVASNEFLSAVGISPGDTISASAGYDAQLRAFAGRRTLTVVGRAHFLYTPAGQRVVALPLETLQAMRGEAGRDRVSILMVGAREGANVDSIVGRIRARVPQVTTTSIEADMQQVDQRLSYFRQLAFILGAVSLVVGFLLVATLVTVSVNERLGEIVVMRAIGVARGRIVQQIVMEGTAIMIVGALAGLGLGLITARYLNSILASFPGLPAAIDFFYFQPSDAWTALGLLTLGGVLAGIYPSWRGASLPIAMTLREEAL